MQCVRTLFYANGETEQHGEEPATGALDPHALVVGEIYVRVEGHRRGWGRQSRQGEVGGGVRRQYIRTKSTIECK